MVLRYRSQGSLPPYIVVWVPGIIAGDIRRLEILRTCGKAHGKAQNHNDCGQRNDYFLPDLPNDDFL